MILDGYLKLIHHKCIFVLTKNKDIYKSILDAWPKWYDSEDSVHMVNAINEKASQITDMKAPLFRTYLLTGMVKDEYGIEKKVRHYVQTDGLTNDVIKITQDVKQLYIYYSCFPNKNVFLESYKERHNIK